ETALTEMRAHFGRDDEPAAYEAHQRFHFRLYDVTESAWTDHLLRLLWSSAERYVRLAAGLRSDPDAFVAEHEEILDAVKQGDADLAAARLAENLRTTERLLAATYERTGA
ncbi:MAG: FCD domain-containing protein, partial [Actinobacteria bacterium]|nr:FCD domain-containing protein [Actinomycetota bacterium]